MQTSTPKSLLIMTILLILLTLISLATPVLSGLSAGRLPGMMLQVGKFPPENANPPSDGGFQGRQPQPGSENFLQRSDGNAFHPFQATRAPGLGGQAMIYINYGVGVIGAGLAGLAAFLGLEEKEIWVEPGACFGHPLFAGRAAGHLPGPANDGCRCHSALRSSSAQRGHFSGHPCDGHHALCAG